MKVGIITFQYAYNYGAILQLTALQRVLKRLGHEPVAINYLPEQMTKPGIWTGWGIRSGLKEGKLIENIQKRWIEYRHSDEVKLKFKNFIANHVDISAPCYTDEEFHEIASKFDALITGSDQVWQFNKSSHYFLEWGYPYDGIRISYAPSCGSRHQSEHKNGKIKSWIKSIDYLSVRDEVSKEVIENVSGRSAEIVADPTLLSDLKDLGKEVELPPDFIFVYILGSEIKGGHVQMIDEIRKQYGNLQVVALVASAHKPKPMKWADHIIWNGGPAEWLYLLDKAAFVYTDSFHCSLYAMENEKPFIAYYAEKIRAPRLTDISKRYHLSKSITDSVEYAVNNKFWEQKYDGSQMQAVKQHVESSIIFLKNALDQPS
jgi:hypothetical protein